MIDWKCNIICNTLPIVHRCFNIPMSPNLRISLSHGSAQNYAKLPVEVRHSFAQPEPWWLSTKLCLTPVGVGYSLHRAIVCLSGQKRNLLISFWKINSGDEPFYLTLQGVPSYLSVQNRLHVYPVIIFLQEYFLGKNTGFTRHHCSESICWVFEYCVWAKVHRTS